MEQKNFETKEQERAYYVSMLQELIPNLDKFSFLRGSEGKAYFIDENFVVKKLYSDEPVEHFQKFFDEMSDFAEKGLSIPKFYAWKQEENDPNLIGNLYYILEERAKGFELFNEYDEIYSRISDKISFKDYKTAINYPYKNPKLYTQIMYEYINDVNERLGNILSVPEKEFDRFIVSLFKLYKDAKVSMPDIHPGNVFCDGKTLTIIDQYMCDSKGVNDGVFHTTKETVMEKLLEDIFKMFDVLYVFAYMKEFDVEIKDKVKQAKQDVLKRAFGTIKKFVKKSQKLLDYEKGWKYSDYFSEAEGFLGDELGEVLAKELERE